MSTTCDLGALENTISQWPGVLRRQTPTQVVFSVAGTNFCWLSHSIGMVQIWPPLGKRLAVRRLERAGAYVEVIRQQTGEKDAEYHDPGLRLEPRWSYPGFMCSRTPRDEAESLVGQAYEQAKSNGRQGRGSLVRVLPTSTPNGSVDTGSHSGPRTGMVPKVIQVPMEEALVQTLGSWSQKLNRSRADLIREACRRYLKHMEREELDRIYRDGYERVPEEPVMALTQAALLGQVLPKEEW